MITHDPRNILVADDSIFFRTKLSDILTEAGHRVTFARDGKEVIEEIGSKAQDIDLLILDLQMPDVDGFGVLRWMKEKGYSRGFKVLAITGAYETTAVIEDLKDLGADGFMSKGLTPEQIVFRVNRLLYAEKVEQGTQRARVPTSFPVDFIFAGETYTGMLLNISEGGAFLHTTLKLLLGAMLDLKFAIPGHRRLVHAKAAVRWAPADADGNLLFCGYGLMFTSVDVEDQEALKDFIANEITRIERAINE